MQDWHVPLVIAAAVFGAFMLWKVRPAAFSGGGGKMRALIRDAQKRIEEAKDDVARAAALADAGDAAARALGPSRAIGFYLRAMRLEPASTELVDRAAKALAHRPRALESLLWRRLSAAPWTGASANAARAALGHLAALYAGPLHNQIRARAIEHALAALSHAP
jgi:hypothetical protein